MIVVDTNVIACLYLPGAQTEAATELCRSDPEWIAPLIWRSELRNVLVTQLRHRWLELAAAQAIQAAAEELLSGREFAVDSAEVLRLAAESGCSAYDCEFVVLAEYLDLQVVSADRKLAKCFPSRVRRLAA